MTTDHHCHSRCLLKICRSSDHIEKDSLEPIDRASLRETFDQLDHNKDGFIDIHDYPIAYQSRQHLRARIAEMDSNADGQISFEEFCAAASSTFERTTSFFESDGQIKWRRVFEHYDVDKSGFLEVSELQAAFVATGQMTERELQQLIIEMDIVEQDNKISFLEFLLYHLREIHAFSPPAKQVRLSKTA